MTQFSVYMLLDKIKRDQLFSTHTKSSENYYFLSVDKGVGIVSFSEHFAYLLNE